MSTLPLLNPLKFLSNPLILLSPSPSISMITLLQPLRYKQRTVPPVVRALVKKITIIRAEIDKLERLIQQQETVDAVRSSEKEKLRINEALMVQLLKLDSVPGFDMGVKKLRRSMSRRIVGLQEVMDGICGQSVVDGWDGLWRDWDDGIYGIEEKVCRERGGEELEKFCAQNLGFRCFEKFLREF